MKSIEGNFNSRGKEGLSRREFLGVLGGAGAMAFSCGPGKIFAQGEGERPSRYEKHEWFYSSEEMARVYEQEYNGEKILQNTVRRESDAWVGTIYGKKFEVSNEFIEKTLGHLRDMLTQNAARYIFRLDAFHGHLFVPTSEFEARFSPLEPHEQARLIMDYYSLGVLYHNSEHLKIDDQDREAAILYKRRNVIGWYDGRSIAILPLPKGKESAAPIPSDMNDLYPYLRFAAHKDGVFSLNSGGREIRLDLTFDDMTYY
ncbi:MAG: hypothetical protein Q7R91_03090 [bacterium]|nr:hypothetical protein [bacterium]